MVYGGCLTLVDGSNDLHALSGTLCNLHGSLGSMLSCCPLQKRSPLPSIQKKFGYEQSSLPNSIRWRYWGHLVPTPDYTWDIIDIMTLVLWELVLSPLVIKNCTVSPSPRPQNQEVQLAGPPFIRRVFPHRCSTVRFFSDVLRPPFATSTLW